MLKYISIIATLVFVFCAAHSLAASPSSNDLFIAQKETQKKEESDDLDYLNDLEEDAQIAIDDPIASWNRAMFQFNDKLYFYVLEPTARIWEGIIPIELRQAIKNGFNNIRFPIRLFNCLFQGKNKEAGNEAMRFLINTTIGIGGLGDPAQELGYHQTDEDFGQTLAIWGAGSGAYIVWPFFMSSTVRDSFGMVGDFALDPLSYFTILFGGLPLKVTIPLRAGEAVNQLSFQRGDYEALKEAAIDPYEAFKNAYIQYRNKKIKE